jgi:hypothetical protein
MAKAVLSWNIKSDENAKYFEFVVQDFLPSLMKIGIRPTQAWYTTWGTGPQIITTIESIDGTHETLVEALRSKDWMTIRERLFDYITDYKQRITK